MKSGLTNKLSINKCISYDAGDMCGRYGIGPGSVLLVPQS